MNRLLSSLLQFIGLAPKSPLSPEEFTQVFVDYLYKKAPGHEAAVVEPLHLKLKTPTGQEVTSFLGNAYTGYLQSPGDKDALLSRHLNSYLDTPLEAQPLDSSMIVAVVKDREWMGEIRRAAEGTPGSDLAQVFDDLNEDLVIIYAEDSPTNIRYFTDKDLEESGIQRNSLRSLAVANLRRILPKVDVHRGPHISMLTAGADYVSSLLLLEELWDPKKLGLEGEIVLAVPTRDLLLVTSSLDAQGIAQLRKMAQDAVRESPYSLTDVLFVSRGGGFLRLDA